MSMFDRFCAAVDEFAAPLSKEVEGEILPRENNSQSAFQRVTEPDAILDNVSEYYGVKVLFVAAAIIALFTIINLVLSTSDEALFVFLFIGFLIVCDKYRGHIPFLGVCALGIMSTLILPFFSNPRNLIVFFLWFVGSLYSISWLVSNIFTWVGILSRSKLVQPAPPPPSNRPNPLDPFLEREPFGDAGFADAFDLQKAFQNKNPSTRPQFED